MNTRRLIALGSLAAAWMSALGAASAMHPDILREYRFLSDRSTLNVSRSWLDAPDVPYIVSGEFDIEFRASHEFLERTAKFVNVDAFASHPFLDMAPLNLDKVLNLSGLKGYQLPVASPFDVYKFEGHTEDGSAVDLFARILTPWLILDGKTTPPADDKNHVVYELRSVARQLPFDDADFNEDGSVDHADLRIWAHSFGATGAGGDVIRPGGDADGDFDVGGADFMTWQRQSGLTPPGGPSSAAAAVPEPASLALAIGGIVFWAWRRRL